VKRGGTGVRHIRQHGWEAGEPVRHTFWRTYDRVLLNVRQKLT
jgi:hypothetical protein